MYFHIFHSVSEYALIAVLVKKIIPTIKVTRFHYTTYFI